MKALAIVLWVAAWACLGLPVAGLFAARDGKMRTARIEFASGLLGAAGLAWAGTAAW